MATRQEMVCAINLIRHTARANGHLKSLIKVLDGTTVLVDEEDKPLLFEQVKPVVEVNRKTIYDLTSRIKVVVEKANSAFLDNGITDVALNATGTSTYYSRGEISLNVNNVNSECALAQQVIVNATKREDFEAIAVNFKSIHLKTGIVEPDPWQLFPLEVNHANILHAVLDALSYELQGRNCYTGEPHGYTDQRRDKLFSNRIFTANIYLSKLPNNVDKQELGTVLSYIETNIGKTNNPALLAKIGKYIAENLPKLIKVREWWAL